MLEGLFSQKKYNVTISYFFHVRGGGAVFFLFLSKLDCDRMIGIKWGGVSEATVAMIQLA